MLPDRLFLLDAYALIFRAYYALINVPRVTSAGFNTSAVFGFVNTLEEVLRKENPSHIAVCFDPEGPTFRKEADASYKSERESTPEDIRLSVPFIKRILRAYRIPIVQVEGYEADDVIGTLATQARDAGITTYMMTPDKDFGQLVGPNVLQYKPSYRGQDFELRGEREVCQRYGIDRTSQVIDLLALMGDKIDNIPGCPGVGEKTAVKLIGEFGDVENLLASTDKLKGALKRKIEDNAEQIRHSKFMATIRTDVPVELKVEDLRRHDPDREALFAIFRELEFRSLEQRVAKRLDAGAANSDPVAVPGSLFAPDDLRQPAEAENVEWRLVADREALRALVDQLAPLDTVYLHWVADGANDAMANPVGVAIAANGIKAAYVPASFTDGVAAVLDLMARRDVLKVSSECKRDYVLAHGLRNDGAIPLENYYDISLAHYLLQPDMRHDLDTLALAYLRETLPPIAAKVTSKTLMASLPDAVVGPFACTRADLLLRLRPLIDAEIDAEPELKRLLLDVELPLVVVLARMESEGVLIDTEALRAAAVDMRNQMERLENEICDMAGVRFNVGSPSKVGEVLFDRLKLDPKAKKTKSGSYSTAETVLEPLAPLHPIVEKILQFRQLKKLVNTYLTVLPEAINPATGRVHTNYNQTVTATGRISSSDPNLQNIPIRDGAGRDIRRAFIASPGCRFLSADYSQIELRLVADFANEEVMIDAFLNNHDIHAITASKIYEKPLDDVTPDERRNAKTANFGILYGISAFGLSSRLGISRQHATELIEGYFRTFPGVHRYIEETLNQARDRGYVKTKMGRRRMAPDINSRNRTVRGVAERNAINAPIQGTAADIMKVAMINIAARMAENGMKARMIMQVHDELNFDVPLAEVDALKDIVKDAMEKAWNGRPPLEVSVGVADNWLDAH